MEGVPTNEDLGEHYIMVKAFDEDFHGFVKDVFALEVLSKADVRHRINVTLYIYFFPFLLFKK